MTSSEKLASNLDAKDKLAAIKEKYQLPPETIYLDGNSLGPVLKSIPNTISNVVENEWGNDLVGSWNSNNWIELPTLVGEKIAPLIGAGPGQVICADSVSVNLFKLLACALELNAKRNIVLSEASNFPTDLYIAEGVSSMVGNKKCQLILSSEAKIEDSLSDEVAVLLLTQVDFRSGKLHDIQSITAAAHQAGIIVIWDLAHSAGALPLRLDEWRVDFAVGCGYKYLNGGPGAPAFIYAAKRHHDHVQQPLKGWMGHKAPFEFEARYSAGSGMRQFLCGTPPILSMSALNSALNVFDSLSMDQVRDKAIALSSFFQELVQQDSSLDCLNLVSPSEPTQRGNQLAYQHPDAYAICQALIDRKVIADFRSPDILRLGFSPLFLSFMDIAQAAKILGDVMSSRSYLDARFQQRQQVT